MDLVDLDEVIWTDPPEREEAGSPNVVGAVAFGAAMDELERIGWDAIEAHERGAVPADCTTGWRAIDGVTVLGPAAGSPTRSPWRRSPSTACTTRWWRPGSAPSSASASATAASAPTRTSSVCSAWARPGSPRRAEAVRRGDRSGIPGAVRASCGLGTSGDDVAALLDALGALAGGLPAPVPYEQDPVTGDFWPAGEASGWSAADRPAGAACARG